MAVDLIWCPRCSARLEDGVVGNTVRCSQCGSSLHITRGPSGVRQAMLADVETSTVFLAKQGALARLEAALPRLAAEKEHLEVQMRAETEKLVKERIPPAPQAPLLGIVCGLILVAFGFNLYTELTPTNTIPWIGYSAAFAVPGLALIVYCAEVMRKNALPNRPALEAQVTQDVQAEVQARYGPALAALAAETSTTEAGIARLRDELERLAKEL